MTSDRFAKIPEAVLYDHRLSSHAKVVYAVLDRHANDGRECWPSQARIGELAHLGRTATWGAIRELVDAGHVEVVRRGRTLTNTYRVMFAQRESPPSDVRPARKGCSPDATRDVRPARKEREQEEREPLNEKTHARAASNGSEKGQDVNVRVTLDSNATAWVVDDDTDRILGLATTEYTTALTTAATSSHALAVADTSFERFWSLYPKHKGKGQARRAWTFATTKATPADIIAGAERYAADPNLPEPKYIPYPATWLNGERWLDEPEPPRARTNHARTVAAIDEVAKVIEVAHWGSSS